MQCFTNLHQWIEFRKTLPLNVTLGFIPTMGNLHLGHQSLFKRSKQENTYSIASIFVNPTQFNNTEDYINYPRTFESDLKIMEQTGIDFCLIPDEKSLYIDNYKYIVQETCLSQQMEGLSRPGHFNGVLTIVLKLFNLVKPTCAYFGKKDYQQFLLIKGMVEALFLPIKIKACNTVRNANKLAYSSRNNRLNSSQYKRAETFAQLFHQNESCENIIKKMDKANIKVDYIKDYAGRRYAAVWIDDIRLIDNISLSTLNSDNANAKLQNKKTN